MRHIAEILRYTNLIRPDSRNKTEMNELHRFQLVENSTVSVIPKTITHFLHLIIHIIGEMNPSYINISQKEILLFIRYIFFITTFSYVTFYIHEAHSETVPSAGQLIPRSFATQIDETVATQAQDDQIKSEAPPGAGSTSLKIGTIHVENLDPDFISGAEAIIAPLRGTQRKVADVYDAAAKIQKLYSDAGFFLTRVIIPPQHVKDGGDIAFKVVEGFIADVNADALAPQIRARVAAYFKSLKNQPRLKLQVFDRRLRLAAGTNGIRLKTNLKPAKQPLGVTLTLTGNYDPLSAQITMDNSLPASLGSMEVIASGVINSPLGFGDQLYASVTGSPLNGGLSPKSPRRVLAAGLNVPLGDDGLTGNLEYTWSNTTPIPTAGGFATSSQYRRITAKLSYPVFLDQSSSLVARLAFDDIDEDNQATGFNYTLYHDHLSVLRAGVDYNRAFLGGVQLTSSFDLSQGLDGLGARGSGDARTGDPISQAGASDRFTKIQGRFHLVQALPNRMILDVSGRGQYAATGTMMNSEKFVLGGPSDLSGSDSGIMSGDSGWSIRAELQFDVPESDKLPGLVVRPYMFASRGTVYIANPTAAESAVDGETDIGLGIRGRMEVAERDSKQVELLLEAARSMADNPAERPGNWRFNVSLGMKF